MRCLECNRENPDGVDFCEGCLGRLQGIWLESEQGVSIPLPATPWAGPLLLGRHDPQGALRVDIDFDDYYELGVSRRQARLEWVWERCYLSDWASKNGTFVNGERLAASERRPLQTGDTVGLARLQLRFHMASR